jgi:hypothetical protein
MTECTNAPGVSYAPAPRQTVVTTTTVAAEDGVADQSPQAILRPPLEPGEGRGERDNHALHRIVEPNVIAPQPMS